MNGWSIRPVKLLRMILLVDTCHYTFVQSQGTVQQRVNRIQTMGSS